MTNNDKIDLESCCNKFNQHVISKLNIKFCCDSFNAALKGRIIEILSTTFDETQPIYYLETSKTSSLKKEISFCPFCGCSKTPNESKDGVVLL